MQCMRSGHGALTDIPFCYHEVACGSKNWMREVDKKQVISLQWLKRIMMRPRPRATTTRLYKEVRVGTARLKMKSKGEL